MLRTRIYPIVLILLLLTQGVTAPLFVGQAAAADVSEERKCSEVGTFQMLNPDCQPHYGDTNSSTVDGKETVLYDPVPTEGRTAEQVHYDIFVDGTYMEDASDQHTSEIRSHSNQTVALAYSEAWNSIVEVRNSDGKRAEAQKEAYESINDFYAMQEKSLYINQNRHAQRLKTMNQTVSETGNLGLFDVFLVKNEYQRKFMFDSRNVTLFNGSNMTVTDAYYIYGTGQYGNTKIKSYTAYNGELVDANTSAYPGDVSNTHYFLQMKNPEGKTITIMDGREYNESYHKINENRKQALDNADKIVDSVWENCDVGECQPQDGGPIHMIYSMSSNYDSTGHYAPVAAITGSQGYAGDYSKAYSITWQQRLPDGNLSEPKTANGTIFWTNGTFQNGTVKTTTYNASQSNGTAHFVYQDGNSAGEVTFNGTYTVNWIKNTETGEKINQTTSQNTQFRTTDTQDLNKNIKDLLERMEDLEEQQRSGGVVVDVGNPLNSFNSQGMLIGIGIAFGFIFLVGWLISAIKPY
ncbi:hypothetical protein [Haloarcula amylolytica]|uniref:hypothetical protein n=1 Tax=Haloarcula amylolytica TaxID=396317 RepID=UPI003C76A188